MWIYLNKSEDGYFDGFNWNRYCKGMRERVVIDNGSRFDDENGIIISVWGV